MKIKTLFIPLLLISSFGCQSNNNKKEASNIIDTVASADTTIYPENLEASSFPHGELIHERGLLKSIEDSGYPFVNLTIEFPERDLEEYFIMNLEEVKSISQAVLSKSIGKYIDFSYTSELGNSLLDLQINGKSIFDTDIVPLDANTKKVKGVLNGAKEVTGGDLPGKVTVTNKSQEVFEFEYYITEEMVKQNGKEVTAFYDERTKNDIVEITVLK